MLPDSLPNVFEGLSVLARILALYTFPSVVPCTQRTPGRGLKTDQDSGYPDLGDNGGGAGVR